MNAPVVIMRHTISLSHYIITVVAIQFWGVVVFWFQAKQPAPGRRVVSSTPEAEQALTNLEVLRSNKHYVGLAEQIVQAHSFIANPLHSLIEGPEFVTTLAQQLFPNEKALVIMVTSKNPL